MLVSAVRQEKRNKKTPRLERREIEIIHKENPIDLTTE